MKHRERWLTRLWGGAPALLALAAVLVLPACNTLGRQPGFKDPRIEPAQLKPGESAVIAVKLVDKHHVVNRVVGIVKEDPRIELALKDDGQAPDEKAADNVWSLQVDVPFMAAPGEYTLEISAYNSDGEPVLIRTKDKSVTPLAASCKVTIAYPPGAPAEQAPAAPAPAAPAPAAPAPAAPAPAAPAQK